MTNDKTTASTFSNEHQPTFRYPSPSSRHHTAQTNHPAFNVTGISDNQAKLELEQNKLKRNWWNVQKDRFQTITSWLQAGIAKESMQQTKEQLNQSIVGTSISRLNTAAKEWQLVGAKADVELAKLGAQNKSDQVVAGRIQLTLKRREIMTDLQSQEFSVATKVSDLETTTRIAQLQGNVRNIVNIPNKLPEVERVNVVF